MTRNLKWSLCVGIAFLAAAGAYVWWQYFRDTWQPPSVVTIESEEELASLFPAWLSWISDAEKGSPQVLLLREGDFILVGGEIPVRYLASDGPHLKVTYDEETVNFGEMTVALSLSKDEGRKWLTGATDGQLAGLRLVFLPDEIDSEMLAGLQRIAAANPNVDLWAESEAALGQALQYFKPRAVFAAEDDASPLSMLANQPELETLLMSASIPGSLDFLPTLPKLHRLALGEWKVAEAGPLPEGISGLKSLVIAGGDIKDLSVLHAAPTGLQELALQGQQDLTNFAGLDKLTGLRTLVLASDSKSPPLDLSSLSTLKKLRWAGLPQTINQEQFAAFVSTHPDLNFLELPKTENTINLAPLRELKGLQGLVLGGTYENLEVIQELTSLQFVGIWKDIWDKSPAQVAAIRKALPDAMVVRVGAFCLGSGWILLLVPVLGFAWRRRDSLPLAQQAA
jgi:hypothetical protein